ncbi:LysR family transcriptional regulator [Ammoniphilus sp. YIM 78166]|uniref:LysR family transcriptional regulator n=1 Tax=Ammoniphilus sp. YIM 78166 TaxID=1644106 RepID=UPI00106F465F|nr:LysR family transcriptional regulator [Ammoniphilus sp. YIM 78166]
MEYKDWLMLVTIHQERNITKAAERLYTTQPALTYRLQHLEKMFGTAIVMRSKKGVEFTSQGEYLVQYAKKMLVELEKTKDYVNNMDQTVKGSLRLGVSSVFARYKLPSVLKNFLAFYPDVDINLKTGWSVEINHMLHKEEVHLGIVRGDYAWHGEKSLLCEETLCIASTKEIRLEELPQLPRINYGTDQTLMNLIQDWWQDSYKDPPSITMDVDRIDTCKEMVLHGLGYAILPSICLENDDHLHIYKLRSKNNTLITRKTWLIYRESSLQLSIVKAFVEFMEKNAKPEFIHQ